MLLIKAPRNPLFHERSVPHGRVSKVRICVLSVFMHELHHGIVFVTSDDCMSIPVEREHLRAERILEISS